MVKFFRYYIRFNQHLFSAIQIKETFHENTMVSAVFPFAPTKRDSNQNKHWLKPVKVDVEIIYSFSPFVCAMLFIYVVFNFTLFIHVIMKNLSLLPDMHSVGKWIHFKIQIQIHKGKSEVKKETKLETNKSVLLSFSLSYNKIVSIKSDLCQASTNCCWSINKLIITLMIN